MDMENTRGDTESSHHRSPGDQPCGSVSLDFKDNSMRNKELNDEEKYDISSCTSATQILWSTGMLSEPIPNGFYSIVADKKLKELYKAIPTIDDLHALETNGCKADIILVDAEKDKKLSKLKQYTVALVNGLHGNPPAIIKKIAGLVSDVYKRPNLDLSPKKAVPEAAASENGGVQLLGQIKYGSCRPRAILFKVLADSVGLESRLVVGLPTEGYSECVDSYKHLSVLVVLNSVEFLVDLMRFPGQLIPRSSKAIYMTHISATGESDSADYDSCDSPMEPNSPLYGVSERVEAQSADKEDGLMQYRREASSNAAGPSLRNMMLLRTQSIDRKFSLSQSEPNVADSFWKSQRKTIASHRTANPRSEGTSSHMHRLRRRSMSMTPEISDEIVRAVRAMNESMKQNRPLPNLEDSGSESLGSNTKHSTDQTKYRHHSSQKAMSSSSHEYASKSAQGSGNYGVTEEMLSTWNKVLGLPIFHNKPLLPFEEWNIDFSELTVGTRVGIGFFGEVFRGVWNGTEVAIKVFLEQDLTAENMEDFCNEISILSRLRHPNVILFLGACMKPPRLSLVTEYMEMGSLYYLIHLSGQKNKLSWRRRIKMLRDICRGLMCIHRMKIIHHDLKSANCLVSKHWTVKICDFGLSRITTDDPIKSSSGGTPEWMAPEVIRNEPFTEKCDIFSLGVIIWELYTLNRPWDGMPPDRVIHAVAKEGLRLEMPQGPVGRLIADCWAEPHARPSCEEILARLLDCELQP
ncbi:probable serine/threonine-protein kinase SIS8 [Salvia hispanica]|uniref:probable serine/threonine-protein kinase SIS8 n=1 Tax=Salvia hispanica TaxID=49212 RepID=UPI0020094CD4|nr:probable serine/threonine-protein kinase SIS8 [Salvia hispanica]XP_047949730.1 probable serine/threonine-protein kinase SIS8 [Salvia hispanica]